ncbi:MAG: hypothetical protein AAF985_12575 [Bacteroidota bacterium]
MHHIRNIVVLVIITGLTGLLVEPLGKNPYFFKLYTKGIECYLFGMTSFWVLKRVIFYRLRKGTEVVRLVKTSSRQFNFILHGVLLSLMYLAYLLYFDTWMGFNVIMISILLLYYLVQVYINAHPSIYLNADAFIYDDYFMKRWNWTQIRKIISGDKKLEIIGEEEDFILDLNLVDEVDYVKLTSEVEYNVLDGAFSSEGSSKLLMDIVQNYADFYNLKIDRN